MNLLIAVLARVHARVAAHGRGVDSHGPGAIFDPPSVDRFHEFGTVLLDLEHNSLARTLVSRLSSLREHQGTHLPDVIGTDGGLCQPDVAPVGDGGGQARRVVDPALEQVRVGPDPLESDGRLSITLLELVKALRVEVGRSLELLTGCVDLSRRSALRLLVTFAFGVENADLFGEFRLFPAELSLQRSRTVQFLRRRAV